jgi:hypothetical protein
VQQKDWNRVCWKQREQIGDPGSEYAEKCLKDYPYQRYFQGWLCYLPKNISISKIGEARYM